MYRRTKRALSYPLDSKNEGRDTLYAAMARTRRKLTPRTESRKKMRPFTRDAFHLVNRAILYGTVAPGEGTTADFCDHVEELAHRDRA